MEDYSNVQVKILEEPAPKALRFRYECEGRSAGSLPGANSTNEKKTFPKIQVQGYKGRAVVVVSCVTVDGPYRPHPHNLVGKEGCKKGVCTLEISNEDMTCEFSNLGIQCVKKKDIEDSLRIREEIRVDPFRTGFGHKTQPGSIDLNSVRLCFQVFLQGPERGQFKIPLKPTVSDPIYDKKAISDLTIMKLSDCSSPVIGNKEIILLCDKVSKDDIEVRFFEENSDGAVVWEAFGDFQPADVHKQYAISFRTPQYHQLEIESPRRVNIQLRCPSKDTTSLPRPFDYIPLHTGKFNLKAYSSLLLNSVDSAVAHNVFDDHKMDQDPPPQQCKETSIDEPGTSASASAYNDAQAQASPREINIDNVFNDADAFKVLNDFLVSNLAKQNQGQDLPLAGPDDDVEIDALDAIRAIDAAIADEPILLGGSGEEHQQEDIYGSFELAMKNPVIDDSDLWASIQTQPFNSDINSNGIQNQQQAAPAPMALPIDASGATGEVELMFPGQNETVAAPPPAEPQLPAPTVNYNTMTVQGGKNQNQNTGQPQLNMNQNSAQPQLNSNRNSTHVQGHGQILLGQPPPVPVEPPPPRPPKLHHRSEPQLYRNESPPPPIPKRSKKMDKKEKKEGFLKSLFSSKSPKTSPTKSNKGNKNNSTPTTPTSPLSPTKNNCKSNSKMSPKNTNSNANANSNNNQQNLLQNNQSSNNQNQNPFANVPMSAEMLQQQQMEQDYSLECVEQFALYVDQGHQGQNVPKARIDEFYE